MLTNSHTLVKLVILQIIYLPHLLLFRNFFSKKIVAMAKMAFRTCLPNDIIV